MSRFAQLPDGTRLEFPDGTADQVIQDVVRRQLGVAATPAVAPTVPAAAPAPPEAPGGVSVGGVGESVLSVATSAIAEPLSGLAGIAGGIAGLVPGGESPVEKAARFQAATQEAITFEPKTAGGRRALEAVGTAAELGVKAVRAPVAGVAGIARLLTGSGIEGAAETVRRTIQEGIGETAGSAVLEATGSPALAAFVETVPTGVATIVGARNPFGRKPVRAPDAPTPVQAADVGVPAGPQVSVGRPTLDKPVDITPPVSSEQVVAGLRRGKAADVAEAVLPDVKIVESAQRLGVDLNPEHYATNTAFQDVARALKTRPGSQLEKAERAALDEISLKADELVQDIGGSLDKASVSDDILLRTQETISELQTKANSAYTAVREAIPNNTRVDTSIIKTHLDQVLENLGGDRSLLTSAEKKLLNLIEKGEDGSITYAALDRVRRDVGDGFNKRSGPFADNSDFVLREVYGVLSDTQNGAAEAFGVGALYADARALIAKRKGIEDDAVALFGRELVGSIVPKMRQSAGALTKGDVAPLNKLMAALPEARRGEVAATILGDLFAGGARRGQLGTGFANTWQQLNRNTTAKNAIFRHLPEGTARQFDDIGRVISGIVKANQKPLANPSGTAAGIIRALDDASLVTKVLNAGAAVGAEVVGSSVGAPGVATASRIAARRGLAKADNLGKADALLASQEFKDAVGAAIEGNTTRANAILENSPRWKAFVTTIPEGTVADIARIGAIGWLSSEDPK